MKNFLFFITFIFVGAFSFSVNAQNWIWVKGGINGASGNMTNWGIATDAIGNVFEVGEFQGTIMFGTDTLSAYVGSWMIYNSYLVKYSPNGNVLWAVCSNIHGSESASILSVASDSIGNSYITGSCTDTIRFGTSVFNPGVSGFFIAKFDPNGNILWLKGAGSSGYKSWGQSITVDHKGNIYVTGDYEDVFTLGSYSFPSPVPLTADVFIAKYDPNGNVIWVKNATTPNNIAQTWNHNFAMESITTDELNNVYVAGYAQDTIIFGSYILKSGGLGSNDVFLVKYDSNGNLQWATNGTMPSKYCNVSHNGGAGEEVVTVATDLANNIYITGGYVDTISFGQYSFFNGNYDGTAFLVKYNPSGGVIWAKGAIPSSTTPGCYSIGRSVSADKWGHLYWSGSFECSLNFAGVTIGTSSSHDAFLMKLDTSGNVICESNINTYALDQFVVADPIAPDVYFSSIADQTPTYFGNVSLSSSGLGFDFSYMTKWKCDSLSCKIYPTITGNTTICAGQNTTLSSASNSSSIWNNGSTSSSIMVQPTTATTYTLYVSDGICAGDTVITVYVNSNHNATTSDNVTIFPSQSAILTANGGINYLWNSGETTTAITVAPSVTTIYCVIVADINNCIDSACATVFVESPCDTAGTFFFPNAFSPNNDGDNDALKIYYKEKDCIATLHLIIYDRRGEQVFETTDKNFAWDGSFPKKPLNTQVLAYQLTVKFTDGKAINRKGNISLVR